MGGASVAAAGGAGGISAAAVGTGSAAGTAGAGAAGTGAVTLSGDARAGAGGVGTGREAPPGTEGGALASSDGRVNPAMLAPVGPAAEPVAPAPLLLPLPAPLPSPPPVKSPSSAAMSMLERSMSPLSKLNPKSLAGAAPDPIAGAALGAGAGGAAAADVAVPVGVGTGGGAMDVDADGVAAAGVGGFADGVDAAGGLPEAPTPAPAFACCPLIVSNSLLVLGVMAAGSAVIPAAAKSCGGMSADPPMSALSSSMPMLERSTSPKRLSLNPGGGGMPAAVGMGIDPGKPTPTPPGPTPRPTPVSGRVPRKPADASGIGDAACCGCETCGGTLIGPTVMGEGVGTGGGAMRGGRWRATNLMGSAAYSWFWPCGVLVRARARATERERQRERERERARRRRSLTMNHSMCRRV
jgi:hypothetical protein